MSAEGWDFPMDLGWASMLAAGQGFTPYANQKIELVIITNGPPFLFHGDPSYERFMPMRFVAELPD